MAIVHGSMSGIRRVSRRSVPSEVRGAGYAWLALVGAWALPSLVDAVLQPASPPATADWVGPTTIVLVVAAVIATVGWGSTLRAHDRTRLVVPSIVLGSVVTLGWCLAIAVAWTRGGPPVNLDYLVLLVADVLVLSAASIAASITIGSGLDNVEVAGGGRRVLGERRRSHFRTIQSPRTLTTSDEHA